MNRILIVEDEATISRLIEVSLTRAGYACTVANDGLAAADQIEQQDFDLALLDIMLPGLDGYELLDYLRPLGTPVIFITAKGTTKDRVKGLSRGADDYLVKPFEVEELLARVGAVLRRTGRGGQLLTAFGVTLDVSGRSVTQDGNPVELTPREFALLEQLMRNRGAALYRDVLYERVWGAELADTRTLDLHIQRLRKKLGWQDGADRDRLPCRLPAEKGEVGGEGGLGPACGGARPRSQTGNRVPFVVTDPCRGRFYIGPACGGAGFCGRGMPLPYEPRQTPGQTGWPPTLRRCNPCRGRCLHRPGNLAAARTSRAG